LRILKLERGKMERMRKKKRHRKSRHLNLARISKGARFKLGNVEEGTSKRKPTFAEGGVRERVSGKGEGTVGKRRVMMSLS